MDLDFILFPAPRMSWDPKEIEDCLIYIPVYEKSET
jgi:hypothetical protein